jgi:mannan endo-1,4-beta-mannosidase
MSLFPDGRQASCENSLGSLQSGVDWWVDNAKVFALLDKASIINVANEWGPANSPLWREAYVIAVKKLRAAGYTAPLMIDSGGCGQDVNDLLNYSAAVFAADPQKNVIFGFHLYGLTAPADMPGIFAKFRALQEREGMVFVIGEFGPGRNIGPSPTLITPQQVIVAAEANELGWLAWAWDDNNKDAGESDNDWFSMTLHGPGIYDRAADLTDFGRELVLNPQYGLKALAKPASIF